MTRPLPLWFDESKIGVFIHWYAAALLFVTVAAEFLIIVSACLAVRLFEQGCLQRSSVR